ncbi:MAG: VWA domain-containing protein [Myxococcaceae bacterium]|nr:VWA domain-containing protein [Myxococcaceae bacterium]
MKRLSFLSAALAVVLLAVPAFAADEKAPIAHVDEVVKPKIQVAILLDTSSSMDGLINQTREQLWKIVNTFASAKKDGVRPTLELALYQYGNDSLSAESQWIQQVVPLTTNIDKVSEKLFALRTNGGEEYCGAAITKAISQLEWSKRPGDLKLIYIAGNEPFTQGPVHWDQAVKNAIAKGVVVNTIHAGSESDGVSGHWKDAAKLADGSFMTIDQNRAVARIDAPQDKELAQLGAELNKTYVGFGRAGGEGVARQEKQDQNAMGMSASSGATRAAAKASVAYDNSDWDLVDAKKKGKVDLKAMPVEALPAPMKAMKPEEREAYVAQKDSERAEIQKKIQALSAQRDAYIATESKKRAKAGDKSMDEALLESAKAQGGKQAYQFE